jgi:hypothetical protein
VVISLMPSGPMTLKVASGRRSPAAILIGALPDLVWWRAP